MDWVPTLVDRDGPLYRRIVDSLSADIASGRLRRGQQLPTHRALAKTLGIDLTTVTRAYAEARRSGLTEGRVGQGTFVAETISHARHVADPRPAFDLSMKGGEYYSECTYQESVQCQCYGCQPNRHMGLQVCKY